MRVNANRESRSAHIDFHYDVFRHSRDSGRFPELFLLGPLVKYLDSVDVRVQLGKCSQTSQRASGRVGCKTGNKKKRKREVFHTKDADEIGRCLEIRADAGVSMCGKQ